MFTILGSLPSQRFSGSVAMTLCRQTDRLTDRQTESESECVCVCGEGGGGIGFVDFTRERANVYDSIFEMCIYYDRV